MRPRIHLLTWVKLSQLNLNLYSNLSLIIRAQNFGSSSQFQPSFNPQTLNPGRRGCMLYCPPWCQVQVKRVQDGVLWKESEACVCPFMRVDVDAGPGEPAVICGCHGGDNKACVFPSNQKGGDPPLKTLFSLCLVSSKGPCRYGKRLDRGIDGWMEGWAENVHHVVSRRMNNCNYPEMFLFSWICDNRSFQFPKKLVKGVGRVSCFVLQTDLKEGHCQTDLRWILLICMMYEYESWPCKIRYTV